MKKAIFIIGAVVIITAWPAHSGAVDIVGNSVFSDKEIEAATDMNASADSIRAAILSLYNNSGFFHTELRFDSLSESKSIIRIDEGNPTRIGDLKIDIASGSTGIFDRLIGEYSGAIASRDNLDRFADEVVSLLAGRGMPFARAEWTKFELDKDNYLKGTLKVLPGPLCSTRNFVFHGISRTRPGTIERRISLRKGDPYSENRILESSARIERMPYLEIAGPFEIALAGRDDSCDVIFHLRELPSTRFDGAAGYAGTKDRREFVGKLDLDFGDILGTGRSFGLNWKKKDRQSGELRLNYAEPYVFSSQIDVTLRAFQVDRDTLFIETGGNMELAYHAGRDSKAYLSFGLRMVEPEASASVSSSTARSVGFGFEYENTDYPDNPRSGHRLRSDIEYRYRTIRRPAAGETPLKKITSIEFKGAQYMRISKKAVAAIILSGWGVADSDADVPPDELRYIGGFGNLRGYIEDLFPAYRYGIGTLEVRLLTGRRSRAYAFGDFGAISASKGTAGRYVFQPGFGLGLLSPTSLGKFKVEIGWGKRGFPSDAVLNFGIAGEF